MFNNHFVITFYKDAIALFCAASISISGSATDKNYIPLSKPTIVCAKKTDAGILVQTRLWRYLRTGINYLEASGREVAPGFKHPGGKAYGPLALTPIAAKDVRDHYPELAGYEFKDVVKDPALYERFACLYCDLLLRHYIKLDYFNIPKEEVFAILEKAWFLGPTLYREGHPVIASREIKTAEYLRKLS